MLHKTWLILLALAVSGAALAAFGGHRLVVTAVILLLALAKARLVLLDFMEMRGQPKLLASAILGWAGLLMALAFARTLAVLLMA